MYHHKLSQCRYDSEDDNTNEASDDDLYLKCKITTALGLGSQCSGKHIQFLEKWFMNDIFTFEEIENCYEVPWTASSQLVLEKLSLAQDGDKILVELTATTGILYANRFWTWTQTLVFENGPNSLIRIDERQEGMGI